MSGALIFDGVIIAIALVSGICGIMAGLIRELSGLAGLLVGVFASTKYADDAANLLVKCGFESQNPTLLKLCGFLIIFIIGWVSFIIAGRVLAKMLKISGLGLFDRIFGFAFGAAKFLIIAAVVASCVNMVPFLNTYANEHLKESYSWPLLTSIGQSIAHTDELAHYAPAQNRTAKSPSPEAAQETDKISN